MSNDCGNEHKHSILGLNSIKSVSLSKVCLQEIIVYQKGLPIDGCPVSTTDNKRLYYNTLGAPDFVFNKSHEINLANYHNQYLMAFDLISTQEAPHDITHTELTNCTISEELKLNAPLAENIQLLLMGERASTVYIGSDKKNCQKHSHDLEERKREREREFE